MNIYTEEPEDSLVVDEESLDLLLAEVVDEFTNRLQRGESAGIIADELCRQHPELAPAIQDLVPTLAGLATIGRDERGRLQSSNELDEPQADRELGGYRLIRQIGQGGMGVVYEAEDLSLNRMVALKVLRGQAALDSRCLQRFKVEAQAASCLSHPHIVAIYAIGRSDDISYYTMPLIDGLSLDRVIQMLQARPRSSQWRLQINQAAKRSHSQSERLKISYQFDLDTTGDRSDDWKNVLYPLRGGSGNSGGRCPSSCP